MEKQVSAFLFKQIGTREYVLAKAGLYAVRETQGGQEPVATPLLKAKFTGKPVPPPEDLVPVLCRAVDLYDRGGAVDTHRETTAISSELQALGLTHTHGAIGDLLNMIESAAQAVAQERARQPKHRGI